MASDAFPPGAAANDPTTATAWAEQLTRLPLFEAGLKAAPEEDWLITPPRTKARVYRNEAGNELILHNGLISRTFRLAANAATVGFDNLITGETILRGVKPEAAVEIDGVRYEVGGLKGQPNYAFLRPQWVDGLTNDPASMRFAGFAVGEPTERMAWGRVRHHAPNVRWPPPGVYLRMDYVMPKTGRQPHASVGVTVHYELSDGVPVLCKWITIHNRGQRAIRLNRFTSEILAVVEYASAVEDRGLKFVTPNLHVETDYAFSGMSAWNTSRFSVHWRTDPDYQSQVNYLRQNPCLLKVGPELGPDQDIAAGETFESFRAFLLPFDGYDRERNGLAQRRMYRTIAPWVTENPLMMHVRYADWDTVRNAIDQCAEVGFEMVILTFGSGFNIENVQPAYLEEMKRYADYARTKGIEIGGYSLLASRRVGGGNDVVMPEGQRPTFGNSPCLESEWGRNYFDILYRFYERTGHRLLEHDGSYPGDPCLSTDHPGHRGFEDSRWNQWRKITDFYRWCRGKGVYLNVPDYYYLAGSSKSGMGYREVNWSLPRAQQVIHARQNIYDGTWEKTPSMGWMFVPLVEYHGGGPAATIEPLHEHLDHYEHMLYSNLGAGVQACYRGPRLYDTDATKKVVRRWVDWFKRYRDVLEGDVIHLRRADGRDLDYWLNINPASKDKGLLMVFNPLNEAVRKTLRVPLYYTGLTDTARVAWEDEESQDHRLSRDYAVDLEVEVEAHGVRWCVIR